MINYRPMIDVAVAYDDVLIVPSFSDLRSRTEPSIGTMVGSYKLSCPIISSPMDTVTESAMAIAIGMAGGMGIVHRFMTTEEHILNLRRVARAKSFQHNNIIPVVLAVGVGKDERARLKRVLSGIKPYSLNAVAIDVANGHSSLVRDMVSFIRDEAGIAIDIIAGNVATGEGFYYLCELGVNAIRVGIGGGSICKTRIMTGFGVPTLTSVLDCRRVKEENDICRDVSILADGGIRYPADLVKSLVAGADAIVAGKILAGTDSSPSEVVLISGEKKKVYRGMASLEVQSDKRGGLKPGTCPEGVSTYIEYSGSLDMVINDFIGGLKSAMTYAGARTLDELRGNSRFIQITSSAISESHAFGTRD